MSIIGESMEFGPNFMTNSCNNILVRTFKATTLLGIGQHFLFGAQILLAGQNFSI